MIEFISNLAIAWCAFTYWLGGQGFPKPGLNWFKKESWEPENTRGYKWIRRYLMPSGLCVFLVILGAIWWQAFLACSGLSAACHPGYQNKVWKYALTGLLMGAPALILCWPHFNWMVGLPFTYHTAYGAISLKWNRFKWSYVAWLMGTGIAIAYLTSNSL